jgi:hypothetical protein
MTFTDPYQDSYPPSLWGGGGGGSGTVTTVAPSTAAVGAAGFTLTVAGTGFTAGSVVSFDGDPRTTTYVSPTQLTAPIASPVGPARTVTVSVSTGGSQPFIITATQEDEPQAEPEKAEPILMALPDEQEPS